MAREMKGLTRSLKRRFGSLQESIGPQHQRHSSHTPSLAISPWQLPGTRSHLLFPSSHFMLFPPDILRIRLKERNQNLCSIPFNNYEFNLADEISWAVVNLINKNPIVRKIYLNHLKKESRVCFPTTIQRRQRVKYTKPWKQLKSTVS